MCEPQLRPPLPHDVYDGTQLTRSVAQGIFSSLEIQESGIFFEEALVYIDIDYRPGRRPPGRIRVSPEKVKISHAVDPFKIASEQQAEAARPSRARQVRWVVRGLAETDRVVIRPKEGSAPELFNFLGGSAFEIPAPHNSIASGLPFIPHFEALSRGEDRIVWRYNVEVWREERRLFWVDPEIHIEGDY